MNVEIQESNRLHVKPQGKEIVDRYSEYQSSIPCRTPVALSVATRAVNPGLVISNFISVNILSDK